MIRTTLASLVTLALIVAPGGAQCFVASDYPVQGSPGLVGAAVAIEGDLALVGAPLNGPEATVEAYQRIGGVWTHTQTIPAFDTFIEGFNGFGRTIALEGGLAAIGAPDWGPDRTGALGIYRHDGALWQLEGTFTGPFANEANTNLGISLAIEGERVFAGSLLGGGLMGFPLPQPGRVRIFERVNGTWQLDSIIFDESANVYTGFGFEIDVEGDRLAVGSLSFNTVDPNNPGVLLPGVGRVEVFSNLDGTPVRQVILPDVLQSNGFFGLDVELAEGRLFATGNGQIFVFEEIGGVWTQLAKFGHAGVLSVADGRVYSAARVGGVFGVYVYEESGAGWGEVAYTELGSEPFPATYELAADAGALVVGDPRDDTFGVNAGAVFFYDTASVGQTFIACDPTVSVAAADATTFDVRVTPQHAGRNYIVVGSLTGTTPSTPVQGVQIPLVPDFYFAFTATSPNTPLLQNSAGVLDAHGQAQTTFQLPANLPPAAVGVIVYHAAVVLDGGPLVATNAASIELVP